MPKHKDKQGLGDFLVSLSEDDAALAEYHKDKHGFLDRAPIADEHREALRTGDVQTIRTVLITETTFQTPGSARPCFVIVYRELS
jgi:hypothetical protein